MAVRSVSRSISFMVRDPGPELVRDALYMHLLYNDMVGHYVNEVRRIERHARRKRGARAQVARILVREILAGRNPAQYDPNLKEDDPAAEGDKNSRAVFKPWCDLDSDGSGLRFATNLEARREYLARLQALEADPFAATHQSYRAAVPTGTFASWFTMVSKGVVADPDKIRKLASEWVEDKSVEADPKRNLWLRMHDLGMRYEGSPWMLRKHPDQDSPKSIHQAAFAEALAILSANATWSAKRDAEKAQQAQDMAEFDGDRSTTWWAAFEALEEMLTADAVQARAGGTASDVRLMGGTIRGWRKHLLPRWRDLLAAGATTSVELVDAFEVMRRRHPDRFGDRRVFAWLAEVGNWDLWRDQDRLSRFVDHNVMSRPKKDITFTHPHGVLHPQFILLGGSSAALEATIKARTTAQSRLKLERARGGAFITIDTTLLRAADGLDRKATLTAGPNRRLIVPQSTETDASPPGDDPPPRILVGGVEQTFTFGGVRLVIGRRDRQRIENRIGRSTLDGWRAGVDSEEIRKRVDAILAVWRRPRLYIYATLAVDPRFEPPKMLKNTARYTLDLNVPRLIVKHEAFVGKKVVGIDLGMRHAASMACFSLDEGPGEEPVQVSGRYYANFQQTGTLALQGQETAISSTTEHWQAIHAARQVLAMNRLLARRLQGGGDDWDDAYWEDFRDIVGWETILEIRSLLAASPRKALARWDRECVEAQRRLRELVSPRHDKGFGTLTSGWIQILDTWVSLERAFAMRVRGDGQKRVIGLGALDKYRERLDRKKDDLARQTAAGIVKAAAEVGAQFIVLEALESFRASSDRSRRENRKLALWRHRTVNGLVKEIAAATGIKVCEVGAQFTSRFDAHTKSPGCRAIVMTPEIRASAWFLALVKSKPQLANILDGHHVLREGGPVLLTVDGRATHADINAAKNIALRFVAEDLPVLRLERSEDGRYRATDKHPRWEQMVFTPDGPDTFREGVHAVAPDAPFESSVRICRDINGQVHGGHWVLVGPFWREVQQQVETKVYSGLV